MAVNIILFIFTKQYKPPLISIFYLIEPNYVWQKKKNQKYTATFKFSI